MIATSRSLLHTVLAPGARPLRFVGTGLLAAAVQLTALSLLTHHGWGAFEANAAAFLLAAQVNFALSLAFTWRDRAIDGSLWRRWLLFHGSIALTAALNMFTFAATRSVLPTLAASAAGIAVGAIGNYLAGDRLIFRGGPGQSTTERRRAA